MTVGLGALNGMAAVYTYFVDYCSLRHVAKSKFCRLQDMGSALAAQGDKIRGAQEKTDRNVEKQKIVMDSLGNIINDTGKKKGAMDGPQGAKMKMGMKAMGLK